MRAPRRTMPPAWLDAVGLGNLLATAVLVVATVALLDQQPAAGPIAHVLVPLSVLPLLAFRRYPAAAPLAVAGVTLATQIVTGPLITCGVVLPTALIMAFQLGSRMTSSRQLAVGGAGLIGTLLVEVVFDPALAAPAAAVFVFGLGTTFFMGGLMVRSRVRMAVDLRRRTAELADQRDRTAALAVAADRERIGTDLQAAVRGRIDAITRAMTGLPVEPGHLEPGPTRAALAEVEELGRATLAEMRAVISTLRDAPTRPAPGLAELPALVDRLMPGVRVRWTDERRVLPASVELSAYRIVERLLPTLESVGRSRIEVTVRCADDTLRIELVGTPPLDPGGDIAARAAALSAARVRAELVGGRIEVGSSGSRPRIEVVLPTPMTVGRPR